VVAHLQKDRLAVGKLAAAEHRVAIAERLGLLDIRQLLRVGSEHGFVRGAVTLCVNQADLLNACGEHLIEQKREGRLLVAIAVRERLQRETTLCRAGGSDQGFGDTEGHGDGGRFCIMPYADGKPGASKRTLAIKNRRPFSGRRSHDAARPTRAQINAR